MAEENPFTALANSIPGASSVQKASKVVANKGMNLATRILAASQVPTTLVNQAALGEQLDPSRVTTGTDVIRELKKRPIAERFTGPDFASLAVNPFAELAKTAYKNIPAAASVVTPVFEPKTKKLIEKIGQKADLIPGIGPGVGLIAGKIAANPEVVAGLASDVVRDPLNVAIPIAKAAGITKMVAKGAKYTGFKMAEAMPPAMLEALKTRFVHPIKRVEPGVKKAYESAIGSKNIAERDIIAEGQANLKKLEPLYGKSLLEKEGGELTLGPGMAPEMEGRGLKDIPTLEDLKATLGVKTPVSAYVKGIQKGGVSPNTGKKIADVELYGVKGDPEALKAAFGDANPGSVTAEQLKKAGIPMPGQPKTGEAGAVRLGPVAKEPVNRQIVDLLEQKNYKFQDAIKVNADPKNSASLHTFIKGFKANRQTEKEALTKAGLKIEGLEGIDYATHIMTDEAKKTLGEEGAKKMGLSRAFDLQDPSLYKRHFEGKTINEINDLFAAGKAPGYKGIMVPKFFETDPVLIDAVAKTRTAKILAEKEFYDGLEKFAKNEGTEVKAVLLGKDLLKGKKFDKPVAELIDNAKNFVFTDELTNVWDKATSIWKMGVLATPQFHARNAFTNLIAMMTDGFRNPGYIADAHGIANKTIDGFLKVKGGQEIPYKQLFDEATAAGFMKGGFFNESPKALKEALYPSLNPFKANQRLGGAIEGQMKFAHYLSKRAEGLSAEKAIESVKKTLYDYSELTAFERQVLKRTFPFYTWLRKNIPRQLEIAVMHPGVNSKQAIVKSNLEANEPLSESKERALPEYFNDMLAVHFGSNADKSRELFASFGTPLLDLTKFKMDPKKSFLDNLVDTGRDFLGDLNPFAKLMLQTATKTSLLTGEPNVIARITDKAGKTTEYIKAPEWVELLPKTAQRLIGVRELRKSGKPAMPLVLGNILDAITIPHMRLAGKVTGEKVTPEDQAFSVLSFLTGVKFISENVKKDMYFEFRENKKRRIESKTGKKLLREVK